MPELHQTESGLYVPDGAEAATQSGKTLLQAVPTWHPGVVAEASRELRERQKRLRNKQRAIRRQRRRLAKASRKENRG